MIRFNSQDRLIDPRSVTNIHNITDTIGAITTGIARKYINFASLYDE